jgi:hypothetical protein
MFVDKSGQRSPFYNALMEKSDDEDFTDEDDDENGVFDDFIEGEEDEGRPGNLGLQPRGGAWETKRAAGVVWVRLPLSLSLSLSLSVCVCVWLALCLCVCA